MAMEEFGMDREILEEAYEQQHKGDIQIATQSAACVRSKLEALLRAPEIRAACQADASFLMGYVSSSAPLTSVVRSMLCCAIAVYATLIFRIYMYCLDIYHASSRARLSII